MLKNTIGSSINMMRGGQYEHLMKERILKPTLVMMVINLNVDHFNF